MVEGKFKTILQSERGTIFKVKIARWRSNRKVSPIWILFVCVLYSAEGTHTNKMKRMKHIPMKHTPGGGGYDKYLVAQATSVT